jgi:hypothetical protein
VDLLVEPRRGLHFAGLLPDERLVEARLHDRATAIELAAQQSFERAQPELAFLRRSAGQLDAVGIDKQGDRLVRSHAMLQAQQRAVGRHDPEGEAGGDRDREITRFEELRAAGLVARHREPEHRQAGRAGCRRRRRFEHFPGHPVDLGRETAGGDAAQATSATAAAGRRSRGGRQEHRDKRKSGDRAAHRGAPVSG